MQKSKCLLAAALVAPLTLSTAAMAEVVWRGDFETGNRTQYSKEQMMNADRLQVVQSPTRQGQHALRVEVRQGDDPIGASGNRNELVFFDNSREGSEYYYAWSTLWPTDYPMSAAWQVVMQWHHPGCCGAPPVRLVLGCSAADCGVNMPDTLFLVVDGKTLWKKTGIKLGEWQDFILHVKWSANASQGFVEMWQNNELVLPKTFARTMFSSSDVNYLKMGLYRDAAIRPTAVVFHDGLVQTTDYKSAYEALNPPAPPAPPPPPPVAPPTEDPPPTQPPVVVQEAPVPLDSTPPANASAPAETVLAGPESPRSKGGCQSLPGFGSLALLALGAWATRRRGR